MTYKIRFDGSWTLLEKLNVLQRRIIVYSIMYYMLNESCISDKEYDAISRMYMQLAEEAPQDVLEQTQYWNCFSDFDGNTGFDLYYRLSDHEQEYLTKIASTVLSEYKKDKLTSLKIKAKPRKLNGAAT